MTAAITTTERLDLDQIRRDLDGLHTPTGDALVAASIAGLLLAEVERLQAGVERIMDDAEAKALHQRGLADADDGYFQIAAKTQSAAADAYQKTATHLRRLLAAGRPALPFVSDDPWDGPAI